MSQIQNLLNILILDRILTEHSKVLHSLQSLFLNLLIHMLHKLILTVLMVIFQTTNMEEFGTAALPYKNIIRRALSFLNKLN